MSLAGMVFLTAAVAADRPLVLRLLETGRLACSNCKARPAIQLVGEDVALCLPCLEQVAP